MSGIYEIRNIINNKVYVGSTVTFSRRFKDHLCELRHRHHGNIKLQLAYNKYGDTALVFTVLQVVARVDGESPFLFKKRLLQAEYEHICRAKSTNRQSGYNITCDPRVQNNFGKGESIVRSKLKESDVLTIVELLKRGVTLSAIGSQFGVDLSTIGCIRNGITWRHISGLADGEKIPIPPRPAKYKPKAEGRQGARLTSSDVLSIKELLSNGTPLPECAKSFGVKYATIANINKGKCWADLTGASEERPICVTSVHGRQKGAGHTSAKLSSEGATHIKTLLRSGVRICEIRKLYPFMSFNGIRAIKLGDSWGHVAI